MTTVKYGVLFLLLAALLTAGCWFAIRFQSDVSDVSDGEIQAPVNAQYVNWNRYTEM